MLTRFTSQHGEVVAEEEEGCSGSEYRVEETTRYNTPTVCRARSITPVSPVGCTSRLLRERIAGAFSFTVIISFQTAAQKETPLEQSFAIPYGLET